MGRYDLPDPKCSHRTQTMRVSSHYDLSAAAKAGEPMASTYCCERQACLDDAREWVRASTRRQAILVPRTARS